MLAWSSVFLVALTVLLKYHPQVNDFIVEGNPEVAENHANHRDVVDEGDDSHLTAAMILGCHFVGGGCCVGCRPVVQNSTPVFCESARTRMPL